MGTAASGGPERASLDQCLPPIPHHWSTVPALGLGIFAVTPEVLVTGPGSGCLGSDPALPLTPWNLDNVPELCSPESSHLCSGENVTST